MRIPLSLSVYEHAARFLGLTPWEVSRDAELIYRAHRVAYQTYQHFPVVVGIDIYNLEAEAYGGTVEPPQGTGIPAITQPLCGSLEDALMLQPFDPARDGRIALMIEAARRLKADFPEADVRLPVSGPFSIAQSLLGLETLTIGAVLEPDLTRRVLENLVEGQVRFSRSAIAAGLGVAFFESAAAPPLLSPRGFREVELPALKLALQRVSAEAGAALPCIIGGDTAPIVEDILQTGTDFLICPAETDRAAFLAVTRQHPEVRVRVNLDPRLYLWGTDEEMLAEVDQIVALRAGYPSLLLGTGSLPYEADPERVLKLKEYCAR
jgi:uroporphyrinogen-III decarboxylase